MIINLTPNESPTIDVVVSPAIGIDLFVEPSPMIDVIGLPGEQGPPGPPGPSGTIVHVGPTPPSSPLVNDLWVDTT